MDPDAKLNSVYNSFFDTVLKPINTIYVDLELLQDLKFGSLLTFITVQEELEYIQHCMPKYNQRLDDHCAKYFPLIEVTEQDIIKRMRDPKYMDLVCTIAPFNSTYQGFAKVLSSTAQHNDMTSKNLPVTIIVNVADLTYPDVLKQQFITAIKLFLKNVKVVFTAEKRYEDNHYENCDVLMLCDLATFVKPDTVTANQMFKHGKLTNTKIFASQRLGPDIVLPQDKIDLAFKSTRTWLEMFCDTFMYIVDFLPVKEEVKVTKKETTQANNKE